MRTRTLRCQLARPQLHELESRSVPSVIHLDNLGIDGHTLRGYSDYAHSGQSVAGAGDFNGDGRDDLIVGTPDANGYLGAAHILYGGMSSSWGSDLRDHGSSGLTLTGFESGMQAGFSVAGVGDVNGDGFDDVLIGAPGASAGGNARGAAYVVYGRASYSVTSLRLDNLGTNGRTLSGFQNDARAGFSVAAAGDVNDDGYADMIIGAPFTNSPATDSGEAYVIQGNNILPNYPIIFNKLDSWGFTLRGFETGAQAGYSVAGAGRFNVGNNGDVIVGAPRTDVGGTDRGAAYVVLCGSIAKGSSLTLNSLGAQGVTLRGFENDARAGTSVAGAGDFNGDGYADVLVGAPETNGGGAAYLVNGQPYGFGGTVVLNSLAKGVTFRGDLEIDDAGASVAGAGDFDGDGFDDVIIGAPHSRWSTGEAFAVRGRNALASAYTINLNALGSNDHTLRGYEYLAYAGASVAGAGDINGDGRDDVLVGAPGADCRKIGNEEDRGTAYLVYGRQSVFLPAPMFGSMTSNTAPRQTEQLRKPAPPSNSSDALFLGGVYADSDENSRILATNLSLFARADVQPDDDLFPDDWLLTDRRARN